MRPVRFLALAFALLLPSAARAQMESLSEELYWKGRLAQIQNKPADADRFFRDGALSAEQCRSYSWEAQCLTGLAGTHQLNFPGACPAAVRPLLEKAVRLAAMAGDLESEQAAWEVLSHLAEKEQDISWR